MIRELNKSDIHDAFNITQKKVKRAASRNFTFEEVEKLVLDNQAIGYFEDGKLMTWVSYRFGELHGEKVWCILHMFTSNFSSQFTFDRPDFEPIISSLFDRAESWQVYSYLYVVPEKVQHVYYNRWKKRGRYATIDLIKIPANTIPSEKWMQRLIGNTLPYDCIIKKRTLKVEFRNDHDTAV